jgi:hypothetical protein
LVQVNSGAARVSLWAIALRTFQFTSECDGSKHVRRNLKKENRHQNCGDAAERERARRIIVIQKGQKLISMEPLRPMFEMTTRLAGLMPKLETCR